MVQAYNAPAAGAPSTIGTQFTEHYYQKKALVEARKEQYFTQLADVTSMPKNMGKKIKLYHYIPLLDDANINDQGIDAAGAVIDKSKMDVQLSRLVHTFTVEAKATAAAAAANAIVPGSAVKSGAASPWTVTFNRLNLGFTTSVLAQAAVVAIPGSKSAQGSGNLYGSSKDVGTITGKLPLLSETGGRVNRVGFKRVDLEGTFEKFGFFDEYTQESLDFDTDAQLMEHINREMVSGAVEITEDALQIDLLNSAGVIKYAGAATKTSEVGSNNIVTYGDLLRLGIDLDNNRTPKQTTAITGTRLTDTKVIAAARILYMGSELLPTLEAMKDLHNERAFIPVAKYSAGGSTVTGEVGSVGPFRCVVVPEMVKWAGGGAPVSGADAYETNGLVDVFPMLVIGDKSFTTIGFQTDGKTVKFKIYHKAPGEAIADRTNPYGEVGFMSIKWYYGFLALRPERMGLIKTAAKL